MRHSASHVMAEVIKSMFPDAKFGIGPTIEDGFYYDFDLPRTLTTDDLTVIEARMQKIIDANLPFTYEEIDKEAACKLFKDQPYKLELIDELPGTKVTIYKQGYFIDLCRGPHVSTTGQIKAIKILSVAGAYWRGDERRPMLQRVYGTAFDTREGLDEYIHKMEEATRRDHRKLGKDLDLFSMHDEAGAGLIMWHPKGAMVRKVIEDFWRAEHIKRDYDMVFTPHIAKVDLWKRSGHWDFYRENMYQPMDMEGQGYIVKPMNCPSHILMYKTKMRSYRELPLRWAELGTVYRWERSGTLHGLTRVRGFTQDDAHIFCRPDQLESEVTGTVTFSLFMLKAFGFNEYEIYLSTKPEKYVGSDEVWEYATTTLKNALERLEIKYMVDPGGGVFYGPKIDIKLKDAIGRTWQGPTTQVDFQLPERFDVNYIGQDSAEHRTVMVHRTVLGSMERFMGCLIEHYAGEFPVWLSPIQIKIIPIADRHIEYARKVAVQLKADGMRVEVDDRGERMNLKIREAQMQKIPYMLVVGDREESESMVSVRLRDGRDLKSHTIDAFKETIKNIINSKLSTLWMI
ncbi:MAG: threonine--tRNA ligase [Chloroflexi bacterium]|nr:threonine--tRNA ligase [Chloroflexota bacterium]